MSTFTHNFSGDGQSAALKWNGGGGTVVCQGTFGGGTVSLQISTDGVNYVTAGSESELTADGSYLIDNADSGCTLRFSLTGSTSPDLNCTIIG